MLLLIRKIEEIRNFKRTQTENFFEMRAKRESMGGKSGIPTGPLMRNKRRESANGRIFSRPSSQAGDRKSSAPPRKKLDYFAYINDFFASKGKEPPFPNRLKSYDQIHFQKAAADLISMIDSRFEGFPRNARLDHEFCDIMEILGYPYDNRQYYHQPIGTERNFSATIDPLRWLVSLISSYNPYLSIPEPQKKYDDTTRQKLDFFRKVIEAFALWLQGNDGAADEIMNNILMTGDNGVEKENEMLQAQYENLMKELQMLNGINDPCSSIQNDIQRLKLVLSQKDDELNQLSKKREELLKGIKNLEEQNQDLLKIMGEYDQEIVSLKSKVNQMPYDSKTIQQLLNKPELIKNETENERNEIIKMTKEIQENERQFKDQCEALSLIANDMNEVIKEANIASLVCINDKAESTDEMFGTNLDQVIQNIFTNKPDIQKIEIERAKINTERHEIEEEMKQLRKEEEDLLFELESNKDGNGKDIEKLNRRLMDAQNETKKLSREIQTDQDCLKTQLCRLEDKYKTSTRQINEKLNLYLRELQRVQNELQC